jgi:hypothetical protein
MRDALLSVVRGDLLCEAVEEQIKEVYRHTP